MAAANIDDFYYVTAEALCTLYAAFPVRYLLLVEDISGPIRWDMTGLPDRRSRACFETLLWLAQHELLSFRTVEPRDIGIEGAVLTQKAFVLLTGSMSWADGVSMSRVQALQEARGACAYTDMGVIIQDLLRANCQWSAPAPASPLPRSAAIAVVDEAD